MAFAIFPVFLLAIHMTRGYTLGMSKIPFLPLGLGFGLLFSSPIFAITPIEDPQNLLAQLTQSRTSRSFSENFQIGDQADVTVLSEGCQYFCEQGFCGAVCMEEAPYDVKKAVAENDGETATAVYSNGKTEIYVREELVGFGGSARRQSLAGLDVFVGANVRVKLTHLKPIEYRFSNGTTIPAFDLTGDLIFPGGVMPLKYTVSQDLPGIAEILFLQVGDGFGVSKVFRVKGFKRAGSR